MRKDVKDGSSRNKKRCEEEAEKKVEKPQL
jgi:hypothetical protein